MWMCLEEDLFKLNVDTAIFKQRGCSGFGVVIRDKEGCVLAAIAQKSHSVFSPAMMEALAVLKAIQCARTISFQSLIVEGDNLNLRSARMHRNENH